jgi:hypothetical protein
MANFLKNSQKNPFVGFTRQFFFSQVAKLRHPKKKKNADGGILALELFLTIQTEYAKIMAIRLPGWTLTQRAIFSVNGTPTALTAGAVALGIYP